MIIYGTWNSTSPTLKPKSQQNRSFLKERWLKTLQYIPNPKNLNLKPKFPKEWRSKILHP